MPDSQFYKLVEVMARLRGPDGCPWDRQQNYDTIKPFLLEETYEVVDAIGRRDWDELANELGDLLLQIVFFAQMASEEKHFAIEDVIERIHTKMVRRHPHVFGDAQAETAADVLRNWEILKAEEKRQRLAERGEAYQPPESVLAGGSSSIPSLMEAYQLSSRAAPGDLLFTAVNIARYLRVDAESALRGTNRKFRRRFQWMERELRKAGKSPRE